MKRAPRNVLLFLPILNFLYAMFLATPAEGPDVTALNSTMSNMALLAALVYAIVSTFIGSFSKDDLIKANSAYSSTGWCRDRPGGVDRPGGAEAGRVVWAGRGPNREAGVPTVWPGGAGQAGGCAARLRGQTRRGEAVR